MYTVKNGRLFYSDSYGELYISKPAIMYDKADHLLLKHGEAVDVKHYFDIYTAAMRCVHSSMADAACFLELALTPQEAADFLNQAIAVTGCIDKQLAALHLRELFFA